MKVQYSVVRFHTNLLGKMPYTVKREEPNKTQKEKGESNEKGKRENSTPQGSGECET